MEWKNLEAHVEYLDRVIGVLCARIGGLTARERDHCIINVSPPQQEQSQQLMQQKKQDSFQEAYHKLESRFFYDHNTSPRLLILSEHWYEEMRQLKFVDMETLPFHVYYSTCRRDGMKIGYSGMTIVPVRSKERVMILG